MPDRSPAIAAAARAIGGESDLDALMPALDDWLLARVIACAPDAHPLVGAVAALCGRLLSVPDPSTVATPAFHDAMTRLIGTPIGTHVLTAWAEVAPAGWGAAHAEALIDAVQQDMVYPAAAAALIGPCDESAVLLAAAWGIAFAIRCWGRSVPNAPTAWADALSTAERRRVLDVALRVPRAIASCLPWMPPDEAKRTRLDARNLNDALDAFTAASPTARTQGAAILRRLVARTRPMHLLEITRLACAMRDDDIWRRVQMLIQASPEDAWRVVAAAPWDDLPEDVRAAILKRADRSPVCVAVAAARGQDNPATVDVTHETAAAFFAALDPRVWDALDAGSQRRWLRHLVRGAAHLAVRSLGLRPEFLARATLGDDMAGAIRRHAHDATTLRASLYLVALRSLPPDKAHALIAAMPSPRDSGVVFCIASGAGDPDILAPARAALRAPDDLALAVVMQRTTDDDTTINVRCAALRHALRGRARTDMETIMPLLTDDARAVLMPDPDALVVRLAHPDHQAALRQALDRLTRFPPEVAVPTCVALTRVTSRAAPVAADALAEALQAHGDLFLEIADALTDDLRAAVLPLPEDAAQADALRALAQRVPPTARRLAHAFHTSSWRDALLALLHAPQGHAAAVWQALDDDVRQAIHAAIAAAPPDAASSVVRDPIAALALAAIHADDADLYDAGVTALGARSGHVRAIWGDLPPEMQQLLGKIPAFADLSAQRETRAIRRGPRR